MVRRSQDTERNFRFFCSPDGRWHKPDSLKGGSGIIGWLLTSHLVMHRAINNEAHETHLPGQLVPCVGSIPSLMVEMGKKAKMKNTLIPPLRSLWGVVTKKTQANVATDSIRLR